MSGHTATPGPWHVEENDVNFVIRGKDMVRVTETSWHGSIRNPYPLKEEARANITSIVTACNSHAELVKALEAISQIQPSSDKIRCLQAIEFAAGTALEALATLTARKVG